MFYRAPFKPQFKSFKDMTQIDQRCLATAEDYHPLEDYQGRIPRWCVGCGDHTILTALLRLCRDEQLPPEKTVFVSGIGCSSRFPHYLKTYGFHSLHGRALPVAEGIKVRRPDLHVIVSTGDGDCCSIGAGHWIHAIRYNMNMTVLMHDNCVYGLTKMQASPTSPQGLKSNTSPRGALLAPLNPLVTALSVSNASFVAQAPDWIPDILYSTIAQGFHHKGFSFIRILQRCPNFLPELFDPFLKDPEKTLVLTHPRGIQLDASLARIYRNQAEHDPADLNRARELASNPDLTPVGILYRNDRVPCYEDLCKREQGFTPAMIEAVLNKEFDKFTVQPRHYGNGAAAFDGSGPWHGLNDRSSVRPLGLVPMNLQPSINATNPVTNGPLSVHPAGVANNGSRTSVLNRWPALLRRYRELTSLRHDYPLILIDHGSERGIESLTAVVNSLLHRVAPRGPAGERMRRHVLRLEQEIRSLVFRNETGRLSRLWSMGVANLTSRPDLSTEEKQLLRQDFDEARSALDVEGEVIGCDANTADRVMRPMWRRTDGARVARTAAQLRRLGIRLNDLLRSDDLESDKSRQPEALQRAFGSRFCELIDFQAMSRTLCGNRPHGRMPANRRRRIEWALGVLHEEKFFGVEADIDRYEFVFESCSEALAEYKGRLPRMVDVIKATQIAALELEYRYRDEIHDDFFGRFDADSLTTEDIRRFPSYFVSLRERDCDAFNRANLIEILSSDLPIKLVFQVHHLLPDTEGQPETLGTTAWRTQLASMAVNLGSAFVLQTATSNLCPMAERLVDGLAAPGPALFCLFSPGEDSGLPPYLAAAAAIESRLFPTMVFDPGEGDTWAECFSLDGNPQRDRAWPVHSFTYEDEQMQALTENLSFTVVDFLAMDHSFADSFQPVPRCQWTDEMVPLADYLQADDEQNSGREPYLLVVGPDDLLRRVVVTSAAVQFAQRISRRWHRLQELGGINNSHTRRALDEARRAWESEKRNLIEESRRPLSIQTEFPAAEPTIVLPVAAPEAGCKVKVPAPVRHAEAWIETPRCTSCNECTNRNTGCSSTTRTSRPASPTFTPAPTVSWWKPLRHAR